MALADLAPIAPSGSASDLTTGTLSNARLSGPLDGTSVSKTSTYSVANTDKRKTISLGGNAFYTLTMPAPSGFDADFQVRLHNADIGRGKTLAINGYSNFILWPLQSVTVMNVGGVWQLFPRQQRWMIGSGGATFYVDPSGNNANDGLVSGAPLQTVLAAWNLIRDQTDGPASIQLTAGGTYGAIGELDGDFSGGFGRLIGIIGDPTLANPPQILAPAGQICVTLRDGAWVAFNGILFGSSGSGSLGVSLQQKALADFANCWWGSMVNGFHISIQDGADCNITGHQKITGNALAHWEIVQGGKLLCGTVTVDAPTPVNFSIGFILADTMARIVFQNPTFTNSGNISGLQYVLTHGCFLATGGVTVPGSAPGTADATSLAY